MTTRSRGMFDDLSNDPELIRDPHDSSSSVPWDDRTTDNQAKCAKLFREIVKRVNIHYVIRINLAGPPTSQEGRDVWPHVIYPLEFSSKADAHDYLTLSPDPALRPTGYKGWSVESIRSPKPKIHEPRVRRENLVKSQETRVKYYG